MNSMKAVIVGGDAAGMSAASQIKRQQPDWDVIVFEMGKYISYAACGTPYYIEGLVEDINSLVEVTPEEAREKRKIDLRLNHQVMRILPAEKKVVVQNETGTFEEEYDKLMIATGARPNTLNTNIEEYEAVFTINNLVDAEKMREYILREKPSRIAVIGGGFIGIEMVEAVREQGIETIHIHRREDLNRSFEKEISDIIKKKLIDRGVQLKFNHVFKDIQKNTSGLSIVTDKG
jgi:NADPH-dependent 2,4-dienoyl-CoA reductase/sulfur reductase-like enzyme